MWNIWENCSHGGSYCSFRARSLFVPDRVPIHKWTVYVTDVLRESEARCKKLADCIQKTKFSDNHMGLHDWQKTQPRHCSGAQALVAARGRFSSLALVNVLVTKVMFITFLCYCSSSWSGNNSCDSPAEINHGISLDSGAFISFLPLQTSMFSMFPAVVCFTDSSVLNLNDFRL